MATTAGSLSTPLPPHADNLGRAILDRVAATPDKRAFMSPGPADDWSVSYTWREAGDEMMKLGAGLLALGLELEDRVAIASSTRTEWIFADGAVMLAGGANTTIYPSTSGGRLRLHPVRLGYAVPDRRGPEAGRQGPAPARPAPRARPRSS